MTTPRGGRSVRIANPLSTIAIFFGSAEVMAGIAATVTADAIQIAFTAFALLFPLLVAGGFGVILWKKPAVLYAPGDFPKETPIQAYVDAIRGADVQASFEVQNAALREIVVAAVESSIGKYRPAADGGRDLTEFARTVADEEIGKHTIVIDLPGEPGQDTSFRVPVGAGMAVDQFLDIVYYALDGAVRPYTYGRDWVLVDSGSGRELDDIGTAYAIDTLRTRKDRRSLAEAGVAPGRRLAVRVFDRAR